MMSFDLISIKGKKETVGKLQSKQSRLSSWNSGPGSHRKGKNNAQGCKMSYVDNFTDTDGIFEII